MAKVVFTSELQRLTGEESANVNATTYRELVDALVAQFPKLERDELTDMAVAIDGEIIHDPLLEKIRPDSEVHFLFKISGG